MTIEQKDNELNEIAESLLEQDVLLTSIASSLKNFTEQASDYLTLQKKFVGSLEDIKNVYQIINTESNQWLESSKSHVNFYEEIYPNIINDNEKYLEEVTGAIEKYSSNLENIKAVQSDFELNLKGIMKSTKESFHESDFLKLHRDFTGLIDKLNTYSDELQNIWNQQLDALEKHIGNEKENRSVHEENIKEFIQAEIKKNNQHIVSLTENLQNNFNNFPTNENLNSELSSFKEEIITYIDMILETLLKQWYDKKDHDANEDYDLKLNKMQVTLENIQSCQSIMLVESSKNKVKKWPKNLGLVCLGLFLIWLSPEQISSFTQYIIEYFNR